MMSARSILLVALLFFCPLSAWAEAEALLGTVRDAQTGRVLSGVELRTADARTISDASGHFELHTTAEQMIVRKPGYRPLQVAAKKARWIRLEPFSPRALYMSFWAASSKAKRQEFERLIEQSDINALVIDIKSSRGHIAYRSEIPLAAEIGAQSTRPLKDLPEYLAKLKSKGIYTIGRIVVFKDDLLAKNRPEMAARTPDGAVWQDREKLSWSDPFNQQVRDYNLAVVEEAAKLGFDEVQFDYIRFPADSSLVFSQPTDDSTRVAAINTFLTQAKERLALYPTFTSANIFGYICWKHKDGKIGQRLVDLGERVDYLSPMLYPSGFPHGVPGYGNPLDNPYQVIARSLQVGQRLSGLDPVRFRPWLQAFRDYAFDKRSFAAAEVQAQVNASDATGSNGWMLWNASSRFNLASLQYRLEKGELKLVDVSPKQAEAAIISQVEVLEGEQEAQPFAESGGSLPF